jgi:NADH-quinone oxidoreductase subunit L
MTVPLMVLALLAVVGGLLNLPAVLPGAGFLHHWLEPVTAVGERVSASLGGEAHHLAHSTEWILLGVGAAIALGFAHKGFHAYEDGLAPDERFAERSPALSSFLGRAWGIDAGYASGVVAPIKLLAIAIYSAFDQLVIDGAVDGVATAARTAAGKLRRWADGSAKSYSLWMATGAALLALLWIFA